LEGNKVEGRKTKAGGRLDKGMNKGTKEMERMNKGPNKKNILVLRPRVQECKNSNQQFLPNFEREGVIFQK
jgi:hypothetical protein